MADNSYDKKVTSARAGMHTDNTPDMQPEGTYRFALNGVNETVDGGHGFISNEGATEIALSIPDGDINLGSIYMDDGNKAIISKNPVTGVEHIGIIGKDLKYIPYVETLSLGLNITKQCDIKYRLRRGKERTIYWVDSNKRARTFNFSRQYNFYTQAFQLYIKSGGDPNTYVGEKWDSSSFDLIKSYKLIPNFSDIEILETGSILPGSYNFAIQLVDEDLNPTEWISTTNIVRIYNDTSTNPYHKIRGSKNVNNDAQSFPRANKTIKLTISNLDNSYPYYRIAIIRAVGSTGTPSEKALVSDLYSTSDSNFFYTGNDSNLSEVSLLDILIEKEIIFAPSHIEQLENRLELAGTKGKGVNWCEFQKFASKIKTDIAYKDVSLNNIFSEPNIKNAKSTFMYSGYMPGEVYSMGVVYIFDDNTLSPVFHIPGASTTATTDMKPYEITSRYLDVHNCSTSGYWGLDSDGNTLLGKKVRHHRFPFRKEINKPLFETTTGTTVINKYKLSVVITLNPAWTPGPIEYPIIGSDPAVIPYTFNYLVDGATIETQFNGLLVDTDMGVTINIYDGVNELDEVIPGEELELDPACQLATIYQTPGNERFIITPTYSSYVVSSSINNDVSEILGFNFSNIERPHPDVIGFYIVRNERGLDDRMILDNAVFGPMTSFEQYKSFGLINPKQFYNVNNCGATASSGKTLEYYDKGIWFFNPEFEFFNNKTEYTSIEVEGVYGENVVSMPTLSNVDGSECNTGKSKGVYINDVQAGTSYNPEVNKKKDKDDDGFDLLIGYRSTSYTYAIDNTTVFPDKKRIMYLNAAAYQTVESDIMYNVSVDNKIGMYLTEDAVDTELFFNTTTKKNSLRYGALVRESDTLYSNFITRPYYKEHNNPILFGSNNVVNNIEVFNGGTQISPLNMVSSVFYDIVAASRAKKSNVWKIVLGSVLIVAGVVIGVFTGGAGLGISALGAGVLAGLAISYGVSLAVSGIKFEQFKKMVDVDYEKGLKETVTDGGVFETIRDTIELEDDTVRWFSDKATDIYIESSVPFGLRSGLTCGVPDFIDSPGPYDEEGFRNYLTEKFTVIDRDQGSGRLYKGYPTAEFYDMNVDYLRSNKEKSYSHLSIEYDCCADPNEEFPVRVWWSEQSFQEENVDNYRVFLPNNYRDIEGEHGEITDMYRLGEHLFIHTREALWNLPQSNQERVTDQVVSFIGTGAFFGIPPRIVVDDNMGSAGTQHKWATVKTANGVVFVSEADHKIYLHSDKIVDLTQKGQRNWGENNISPQLSKQLFDEFGIIFPNSNNPTNPNGTGYHSTYDDRYNRVLITKRDYLLLPEKLIDLVIVDQILAGESRLVYNTTDARFYDGTTPIELNNSAYFENKSWTISYSFHTDSWTSFHSYLPTSYIHDKKNLLMMQEGDSNIWKMQSTGKYMSYFGVIAPFIIELATTKNPLEDKLLSDISLQTTARVWNPVSKQFSESRHITFTKVIAYNELQSSGEQVLKVKETESNTSMWLGHQTANQLGVVPIERSGNMWNLNELRDYVIEYGQPVFTAEWEKIKAGYFIDKVVNTDVIDFNKPWQQLQNFQGKYLILRLKFDTFDNVNLTLNYVLKTEQVANI